MILEAVLGGMYTILKSLLDLFPAMAPLPSELTTTLNQITLYVGQVQLLFPIKDLVTVIGIGLGFEAFIMMWRITDYVWERIPGN